MKTMICMGDSLTEGTEIPCGQSWPELVANALPLNVVNHGIGGDTTQGMLSRFYPEVVANHPAFVMVLGGTNDLWWGLAIKSVLANLFSMVFQARYHGIEPVIGLPLPVNVAVAAQNDFSPPQNGYDEFANRMTDLVGNLKRCAKESEVTWVDLHACFWGAHHTIRKDLFLPDGLHPNRSGHKTMAATIVTQFKEQFHFH